ncbi:glycosyltransferase family 2 protein [Mucilaginibacter myungsuensis]|uniref:Glycosyltransferase family 2 protein n=1 Tax=Mucilaginibacter myungsuensis TaxID=649104 RepID=A0A929KSJ7_9SPHI|nr:glycosyltransferase family 2 protein [Mucilaginibacter myungsuensis]MBE9660387.1 glycosyltransferase family 2 protein [Mucilaginibacter myungsuensis]MDN3600429.1 glycosyltransferase family 2 protein [Mucilaginibacter myungsuensis]
MEKIIVLTPVKNEDWILNEFLTATCKFADAIIIADQLSTDTSRSICANFPKVTVIDNSSAEFSKAERQVLLIETARKLFPDDKRIIFCLDADEIIARDGIESGDWKIIKSVGPGTTIFFEKPDLLAGLTTCLRHQDNYTGLAYVDDGANWLTKTHAARVPYNPINGTMLLVLNIKFMHFTCTRPNVRSAKFRYYSVIENIKRLTPVYLRRCNYPALFAVNNIGGEVDNQLTPESWLNGYKTMGLDLHHLPDPENSWHDYEVLKFFTIYGEQKFHLDDIWDHDWERTRLAAIHDGMASPLSDQIKGPGAFVKYIGRCIDAAYKFYKTHK